MAVEWLRSCYQSKWYLLADDGMSQPTAGRYYFSPDATPFYAGVTRLTSRSWYDQNALIEQGLGEDLAAKQKWDNGGLPALNPLARSVGTTTCLQYGENTNEAVEAQTLINGFVAECFVTPPTPPDKWPEMSDYRSCSIQMAYAKLIEWLYAHREADIGNVVSNLLGPSYTLTAFPGTPSFPDCFVAVSPEATLLWADGTNSYQQIALQGAYVLAPPQDMGIFSTLPLWYAGSTYLNSILGIAGANPTGPIFVCGHSYGGCCCLLLAARYRAANPDRRIRYLTYGCPKPGDQRVIDLLATCDGLCIVNENDIIPTVPPSPDLIFALVEALLAASLFTWTNYRSAPNQVLMDGTGQQQFDYNPTLDFQTALAFAIDVIGSIPYPSISEHVIDEYWKRSLLRCQGPEWPLTQADYDRILIP